MACLTLMSCAFINHSLVFRGRSTGHSQKKKIYRTARVKLFSRFLDKTTETSFYWLVHSQNFGNLQKQLHYFKGWATSELCSLKHYPPTSSSESLETWRCSIDVAHRRQDCNVPRDRFTAASLISLLQYCLDVFAHLLLFIHTSCFHRKRLSKEKMHLAHILSKVKVIRNT